LVLIRKLLNKFMTGKKNPGRSFGIIFFIFFLIVSFWPEFDLKKIKLFPFVIAIIFFSLAIIAPKYLLPLNSAWIKLGELLGKFISPIVMALIYFLVITPIAIMLKIFGKDLLKIKFNKDSTYWTNRKKNMGSMKKQF